MNHECQSHSRFVASVCGGGAVAVIRVPHSVEQCEGFRHNNHGRVRDSVAVTVEESVSVVLQFGHPVSQ